MPVNVVINGVTFPFPVNFDEGWGQTVTQWAQAVSLHLLQKTGGLFTLSAEVDLGATFGVKSAYFKSRATNPASAGAIRLGNTDVIALRNFANSGNLELGVNASDQLTFNGNIIQTVAGVLTANRAVITDGSGAFTTSAVTSTEISYLAGVTSAIQTQLNTKISASSSDTLTNKLLSDSTVAFADNGDTTKRLAFQISGISAATTRTATPPNEDFTIVGVDTDQLLTKKRIAYVTKTTTYTATLSDQFIDCSASSAAFTITLPTAVGCTGKLFTFRKSDSTFNAVTIDASGSETIDGALTTTLNTLREKLTILSDGANWVIENRDIPCIDTTYTPAFPATAFGTITNIACGWRRLGQFIEMYGTFTAGTLGVAADFTVGNPTGVAHAYTVTQPAPGGYMGSAYSGSPSTVGFIPLMVSGDTSKIYFTNQYNRSIFSSVSTNFTGNNTDIAYTARFKVSGWNG